VLGDTVGDLREAFVIIIIIFRSEPSMHIPGILLFDFRQ